MRHHLFTAFLSALAQTMVLSLSELLRFLAVALAQLINFVRSSQFVKYAMIVIALLMLLTRGPFKLTTSKKSAPTAVFPISGRLIVDFRDNIGVSTLDLTELAINADLISVSNDYKIYEGYTHDLHEAIAQLSIDPNVETVEVYSEATIMGEWSSKPNDPLYAKQWHMDLAQVPYAWENTKLGAGIIVAVLDTGVEANEDLPASRMVPGQSFVSGEKPDWDGNGHGTHVAGTIAQETNNGIGVTGVAPAAKIMPVKVLSQYGSGSMAGIAAGIRWAADNGAHVINMSLGGPGDSRTLQSAIDYANSKGVVVVVAMGNSGDNAPHYPAKSKGVLAVSSVGPDDKLAFYSSYGDWVFMAAPGGNKDIADGGVWQGTFSGRDHKFDYLEFQGTSMASPHVAGAVALLLGEGAKPEQISDLLKTKDDHDDRYGWGRLDLKVSLERLKNGTPVPSPVTGCGG